MINNKKYILSALAAALVTSSVAVAQGYSSGNSYSYEFRDAVRLKEKGMSGRSSYVFGELARKTGKADPSA